MAFKFVLLAALVACVSAGGPAAYSIASPSADYHSVGASHEHTVKGLYGQNVLSQYSKAVDSAHSSVRVHNSRLTNDGIAYAPHYAAAAYPAAHIAAPALRYAAPAIAAPAVHYASPAVHYPAASVVKAAYPAYGHAAYGHAAYPAAYGHAAYGHAAYGHAAYPAAYGHAAYGHAAYPAAYGHGYAHSLAAPLAYKAPIAAAPIAHPGAVVQFAGLGAQYAW